MDCLSLGGDENTVLGKLSAISSELTKISAIVSEMPTIKQLLLKLTEKMESFEKRHLNSSGDSKSENNDKERVIVPKKLQHSNEGNQCKFETDIGLMTNSNSEETVGQTEPAKTENNSLQSGKKKRRRISSDTDTSCLGKALQENIVTLVEDIQFSSSGLGDVLVENDCLTGDECAALYPLNQKDQIRNVVRLIKGRSADVIKKFLKCVQRFHPEVYETIWKSYENRKKSFVNERVCTFCKLKRSIDIRYIADYIWSVDGINDGVYADIVSHTRYNLSDDVKWEKLADACNKSDNHKILKMIVYALERKGYYSHIVSNLRRETKLTCRCSEIKNFKVEFQENVETSEDNHSNIDDAPLSSVDDWEYQSLNKSQDLYSSENSADFDEENRYSAIRLHVSNIMSDAQNCLALTINPDEMYSRQRSHSFVKSKRYPVRAQRRASCFNF